MLDRTDCTNKIIEIGEDLVLNIALMVESGKVKDARNQMKVIVDTLKEVREELREHQKIRKECEQCGEVFVAPKEEARFCCNDCYLDFRDKQKPKFTCDYCGEDFRVRKSQRPLEHKFCSRACSSRFKVENSGRQKRIFTFKCEECGEEFERLLKPSNPPRRFCSRTCSSKHTGRLRSEKAELKRNSNKEM